MRSTGSQGGQDPRTWAAPPAAARRRARKPRPRGYVSGTCPACGRRRHVWISRPTTDLAVRLLRCTEGHVWFVPLGRWEQGQILASRLVLPSLLQLLQPSPFFDHLRRPA